MNAIPISLAQETPSPSRAGHSLRAVTSVAVLAALGMGLGYARDAALAALFGATQTTDAFFVASLVPNMIAIVIVSGALAPALLPVFTPLLEQRAQAFALVNTVLTLALCVLVPVTAALALGAPLVITSLAPGWSASTAALAAQLVIITAPMVILLGTSALLGTAANALGSFRAPALSPVLVNGTAFVLIWIGGTAWGIQAAALGLVLGALAQLLVQGASLYRQGWRFALSFDLADSSLGRVFKLFVPLALFVALAQIVPLIERIISSQLPAGQLSQLAYANKLFQIPGVVLSGSLAIVLFPRLALLQQPVSQLAFDAELRGGLRAAVFMTLPLSLWIMFNARPLVQLTLERGAFSAVDAALTAQLLQLYSFAILPGALVLILTRGFHARQQMQTPLFVAALTVVVYVPAALALVQWLGLGGLAVAFALSQVFTGLVLAGMTFGWRMALRGLISRYALKLGGVGLVVSFYLIVWNILSTAFFVQTSAMVLLGALLSLLGLGALYLLVTASLGIAQVQLAFELFRARRL